MIFKTALVLSKTLIVYVLLVLIQENVTDEKFQSFYYIAVFVSIYIWVFDFGAFFYTSKNGVEVSVDKISRNLLIQLLCCPLIFLCLSLFFPQNIAILIVCYSITSYVLLILKSSFISRNRIISSLLMGYFAMVPFYALFYISLELSTALILSIILQFGLLVVSYRLNFLILKWPRLKFEKFDNQMLVSNLFSLSGSYVDVFFARYFVTDLSIYILVREAVMKIPSLLQPIYNNIFYPILLKDLRSFEKFFVLNAFLYMFLFLLGGAALALDLFSETTKTMSLLLGILVVLKGLGSLHGALMMSQMASHLSMVKNIIYLVSFVSASIFSLKFSLDFRGWLIMLTSFYGFSLLYDVYILHRLRVMSLLNSLLIFSTYVFGLVLCINY